MILYNWQWKFCHQSWYISLKYSIIFLLKVINNSCHLKLTASLIYCGYHLFYNNVFNNYNMFTTAFTYFFVPDNHFSHQFWSLLQQFDCSIVKISNLISKYLNRKKSLYCAKRMELFCSLPNIFDLSLMYKNCINGYNYCQFAATILRMMIVQY